MAVNLKDNPFPPKPSSSKPVTKTPDADPKPKEEQPVAKFPVDGQSNGDRAASKDGSASPKVEKHSGDPEEPEKKKSFGGKLIEKAKEFINDILEPDLTQTSKELKQSAVSAEDEINDDIEIFKRLLLKHGTNKDAFYHMLERLVDRVLVRWSLDSSLLQDVVRKMAEEGKTRQFDELNNSPEARRQQDCLELEEWIVTFDKLVAGIPMEKTDFATINRLLREFIDHLLAGMDKVTPIAEKWGKRVKEGETRVKLQNLRKTCEKDQYSIIAVGLEKAGKSTLTNNLIGYDLLPRAELRCTMITTIVRGSVSPTLEIEIVFFNRQQFEANLEEAILEDHDLAENKAEIIKEFEDLRGKENLVLSGNFSDMKKKLNDYVANKNRMYSVKSVIVKTDKLKSEVPYEIFDVPGYDSTLSSHRLMAEKAIETADAFIFPTKGKQPNLTDPAVNLLKKIEKMSPSKNMFERGFAVVTNLDRCETAQKAAKCMEDSRKELSKFGFIPQHVFEVCGALELLKIKMTHETLTKEESTELQNLEAVVKRDMPFLKDGLVNFRKSLIGYMGTELPKARTREAMDFGKDVRSSVARLLDQLKKDSDVRSSNPELEKKKQWARVWDHAWKVSMETANEWKWNHVTNTRGPFFDEVVDSFEQEFLRTTNEEDSRAVNLKDRVPKSNATVGLVDVPKIEQDERERLTYAHLKKVQQSTEVIGKMIYGKLEEFVETLITSIGVDYHNEEFLDYFDLETIVPKATCFAQIEALVMRVAFPLGLAYLRWRRPHENRPKALEELRNTCPEIAAETGNQY